MVLRFTDDTAAELRKGSTGMGAPDSDYAKTADEFRSFLRHHSSGNQLSGGNQYYYRKIDGNLDLRLLQDVLSPAPGGFFYAAIRGKKNDHLFFSSIRKVSRDLRRKRCRLRIGTEAMRP